SENLSPAVATGTNVVRNTTSQSLQLATMVVTTVPVVVIYPFLQKYFIQGMTLGSVKE
ncbi:carbohydrate ABC transporter permease, partial [Listeria monocytogenes]|nr:carbohydrate ABC transporter permease [Listeria monocytogenes]